MARPRKRPSRRDTTAATELVGLYAVKGRSRPINPDDLVTGTAKLRRGERLVIVPKLLGEIDPRINAFRVVLKALDAWRYQRFGRFVPVIAPTPEEFEVWRRHRAGWSFARLAADGRGLLGPMSGPRGRDRIDAREKLASRAVQKVETYLDTPQGQALSRTSWFRACRRFGFVAEGRDTHS